MPDLPTKALSVKQPWADRIAAGQKCIENRSDKRGMPPMCKYRGPLWIHASGSMTRREYTEAEAFMAGRGLWCPPRMDLITGAIVGRVEVVGHIEPRSCSACCGLGRVARVEQGKFVPCGNCAAGGVKGVVHDCDALGDSRWWTGGYGLVFANAQRVEPVPCKGALGLWAVPAGVLAQLAAANGAAE